MRRPTLHAVVSRIVWAVVIVVGLWLYLRYFEWRNIYYPTRTIDTLPSDAGLEFEDVWFVAEDGCQLHGWWMPHENARGTIIMFHGNGGNVSGWMWMAADLHRLGVNVFLFDYRGYGRSRGIPTEEGTYRDGRAAFEVARARHADAEAPPVILYGISLGGAVAIQVACDKPAAGLIVESTFSSTLEMGRLLYPWLPVRLICHWRYDSTGKVAKLTIPKLFAHSTEDELVPCQMGRQLHDLAAEPKQFCELRGGHNDGGWSVTPEYWRAIEGFLDRLLPAARAAER